MSNPTAAVERAEIGEGARRLGIAGLPVHPCFAAFVSQAD